jgi:hypothetical protein
MTGRSRHRHRGLVVPGFAALAVALVLGGCGGAGRTEKEAKLSGSELEPGERSAQGEESKREAAELAKNRELLSLLEAKRREEAAEANAKRLEAQANKRAKKREAAAAKKAAERVRTAQENIKKQEAALRTKIGREQKEHEAKRSAAKQKTSSSVGEAPRVSNQSPSANTEGN